MNRSIKILGALSIVLSVTLNACKKEQAPDPDTVYMIYVNSKGTIGIKGGRIMFYNNGSLLNGTSIIIPEGALSEKTEISLEMDNSMRSTIDTLANVLKLEPDGLAFNLPVQLKMVRNNIVNPRVYYFLPDSDSVEEIHITYIDGSDGFATVSLDHFSHYLATERDKGTFEATLAQTPSGMKANLQFGGVLNEILTLSRIPVRKESILKNSNITNALEALSAVESVVDPNNLHANIEVSLEEGSLLNNKTIKTLNFDVFRIGDNLNNFKIKVVQNEHASEKVFNTGIVNIQTLEDFFSGKALVFNFGINSIPGKEYYLSLSWVLEGSVIGDQKITGRYQLNSFNDHLPWKVGYNMSSVDNDTNNNFINDYYDKLSADQSR